MSSVTTSRQDLFPAGTVVSAYLATGRGVVPASGAPAGSAVSSATVASNGVLTTGSLTPGATYILYASTPDRYLRVFAPVASSPSSGVALIGDSITDQNAGGPGLEESPSNPSTSAQFQANGFFTWAAAYLGQRLAHAYNAGLTGATTDTVLSTHLPIVLAMDPLPRFAVVLIGINDIQNLGRSGAQVVANIDAILQQLIAVGITPILCTLTPAGATVLSTQARIDAYYDTQRGIRLLARKRNVVLCDWTAAAGQGDCSWKTNYGDSGQLHPQSPGAQALGQVLANVLAPLVGAGGDSTFGPFGTGDHLELVSNPLTTGTVAATGTGMSGNVATNMTSNWSSGSGTAALSKVARTDLWAAVAEWQQVSVSAQAAGVHQLVMSAGVTSGFSVGDTLEAGCDFQTDADWSGVDEFTFQVLCYTTAFGTKLFTVDAAGKASSTAGMLSKVTSGRFRVPEFVVPATTAIIYPQLRFKGTGTYRTSRWSIRKVS